MDQQQSQQSVASDVDSKVVAAPVAAPPPPTTSVSSPSLLSMVGSGAMYSSSMMVHVLRLPTGTDLMMAIEQFLQSTSAKAACIISVVGSLTNVCLRFANQPDAKVVPLPVAHYEVVSLSGMLSSVSGYHVHMSVADGSGRTYGGHVQSRGNIVYTTMEIVIGIMPSLTFAREKDPNFGYNELVVYPTTTQHTTTSPAAAATTSAAVKS
jgi:predicted DNA-binding protein with PD1-like motif